MSEASTPTPEMTRRTWSQRTKLTVGVVLLVIIGVTLRSFHAIFVPLIIAGIMAYLLHPVVESVSRWTRIPHKLATGVIYLLVLAAVILMAAALTSVVVAQVSFLFGELEKIVARVLSLSTESVTVLSVEVPVQRIIDQVGASLQDTLGSVATDPRDVVGLAFGVVETVLLTIFIFLMAYYLTRDADQIRAWVRGIVPPGYKHDSDILLAELDEVWTAFFRGQLILAIVVAIIITVVATIIGLPQPLFWGLFAGLMEFLPSVGHAIYFIVAALVALIEGSTTLPISNIGFVVVVAVVHLVFTQIDLNVLIPRIIGAQVHLHPMVVIIGIIVGASIGGVLGVALAAPVIASARVIGRYIYAQLFGLEPFPEVEAPAEPAAEPAASAGEPLVPAQEEMA